MSIDPAIETRIEGAPLSAHLATSVDDRPHVAPVWYGYRDGTVYTITGGRKFGNVRRNPRVAVSIEGTDGRGGVEWGVTLLGRATVVSDPDRIESAEGWIYDAYDDHGTDEDGSDDEPDSDHEDGSDDEPGSDDGLGTDGGSDDDHEGFDPGEPGEDYGLLEVEIASGSLQTY